jgi:hypothetical protein
MTPSPFSLAAEKLKNWTPADGDLPNILKLVQRSLDTTTKLTEYEDGKAARVLTAVAFLSALAVGMHNLTLSNTSKYWLVILVINAVYLAFYAYVIRV